MLACGIHLAEIFGTEVASHQFGLRLITFGFGGLAVLAALALWKDQQQRKGAGMRMLGAMALFLFAVSFVHFGEAHGTDAWAHELLLHHAGIPLALVVLLQDYRFLLLDVFIRFLGNALLAVVFAVGLIGLLSRLELDPASAIGGFSLAVTITGVGLALLGFSALRGHLQRWVERRVFRRGNLRAALQKLRAQAAGSGSEEAFLQQAASQVASFAKARRMELLEESGTPAPVVREGLGPQILDRGQSSGLGPRSWAEVAVPLRFAEGGSIRLEAAVEEGALEVTVSDDGPGFPSSGPRENGQGLENVRRRLRLCYGEQGRLQVQSAAGRTKVGFRVPLEGSPPPFYPSKASAKSGRFASRSLLLQ